MSEPLRNGVYKPKEFHGRGVKVVNMGELFAHDFLSDQEMRRIELTDKEQTKNLLEPGDILHARRSLVLEGAGRCSLVVATPEPTTFESSLIRVRLNQNDALPRFYYYYFRSPDGRARLAAIASRTAVSGVTGSDLSRIFVPRLPLSEQRRIASILSAYDDLIENNTRRIAILEEMARRIYEEWFVRFRFPGHENVRMVESELGPVPEGWAVTTATQAVAINPKVKVPKDGLKPFVAMSRLSDNSMLVTSTEERAGNSGSKFQNGDTLFARITPCLENGKTGFVQFLPSDDAVAFGSTEFIVLRSRVLAPEYVYLLARSNPFRDNAIKSMSGASGRQRVQEVCFDKFRLAQPDPNTLRFFTLTVRPMFRLIQILAKKNGKLCATRDLLLPKLISGELDVSALPEHKVAA